MNKGLILFFLTPHPITLGEPRVGGLTLMVDAAQAKRLLLALFSSKMQLLKQSRLPLTIVFYPYQIVNFLKKNFPRSKMKCNTTIVLDVKTSETSGVAYEKISSIAI